MPRENDAWLWWEKRLSTVEQRQEQVEHRQLRFMKMWIASHLTSSTSGPTAQSLSPTATTTTPPQPTASRSHRILEYSKPLLHWAAEAFVKFLLPYIVPALVGAWVLAKQYGEHIRQWWLAALQWLGA